MTFDPDSCHRDDLEKYEADPTTGHIQAESCTCTNWCGEPGEAGCCFCNHRDVYDECPVVGFGCGMGAKPGTPKCDCCTLEQWKAARS